MDTKNVILEKSFALALEVVKYSEVLEGNRKYVIGKQILRAGTSIGANIREAQSSESLGDFIHRLKVADKEACELEYWLDLVEAVPSYSQPSKMIKEGLLEVKKILSKIISTSKKRL